MEHLSERNLMAVSAVAAFPIERKKATGKMEARLRVPERNVRMNVTAQSAAIGVNSRYWC